MNKLKSLIEERKFYKQIGECPVCDDEMSLALFSFHVNDFIQYVQEVIDLLLNHLVSGYGVNVKMDIKYSNDHRIVFYNVDDPKEKYMLVDGEIRAMTAFAAMNLGKINLNKKEDIQNIFKSYVDILFKSFESSKSVQLTDNLSFNYSLLSGCYYSLKDRDCVIMERDRCSCDDLDNVVYINRVPNVGTVRDEYVSDFIEVKKSVRFLFNKLENELGLTTLKSVETNDKVVPIIKK